ncbi:hypothetical protein EWM64_g6901 [Hericium alpestre]|uniref:Uncharacterized protein n=1 Tax=Hericium alpestre TaxID=135208 RepID=A0A4Y9ZTG3_9AGAM|nr:hypothetical protein EWM64_g6901 [Hericium alpestre]
MSAGTASSAGSANMEEVMLTIKKQVIFEMLSTFLQYAKRHWTKEAYNYLAINFILVMFAITSKHPNPEVVLGVTPQSWVEAAFGKPGISTRPDWTAKSFNKACPHSEPRLAIIWEDKSLDLSPDETKYLLVTQERAKVRKTAEKAIPLHLEQLRKQNKAQEAIDALNKVEPERPVPVDPSTVDNTVKDPNFTAESQETSAATSAGSYDSGASEPTLSVVNFPTGGAGPSERSARHIARQERADADQEPEEQSVADANEAAELHLDANAGLPLNASLVFDPDEAQAFSTPAKLAAVAPTPMHRAVIAFVGPSETGTLGAVTPNADPTKTLSPTNAPVAPADIREPISDDGSAKPEQPGAEQATAGPSNDGQSLEPARPALAARTKRKKTTKTSGADAPDDAPAPAAGGPALAGPSNANAAPVLAAPAGKSTRSSSRIKAGVNNQSQSLDAPAADSAARTRTSKKRSQPVDNQGAGNAAAAPSRSKKRKVAPAAQASDNAPGPSNTQRRVNPVRNCNKGGKKKIL